MPLEENIITVESTVTIPDVITVSSGEVTIVVPPATSTTIGGLIADSRDETQETQEVKIDPVTYKLYVKETDLTPIEELLNQHIADHTNPHQVTKAQVGLGDVVNKPMDSTPTAGSENYVTSGGVKTYVDAYGGKIDSISINGVNQPIVNKNVDLPTYPTKTSLGLDQVDNTSDLNKPISTATQTALDELDTAITGVEEKLNESVLVQPNGNHFTYSGDTVTLNTKTKNLKTGATQSSTENVLLANDTTAGMMSPSDYQTIRSHTSRIERLELRGTRLSYISDEPATAEDILQFVRDYGYTDPDTYESIIVVEKRNNHIWNWYTYPRISGQWIFKDTLVAPTYPEADNGVNVNFTANSASFAKITAYLTGNVMYDVTPVYLMGSGWLGTGYKTIDLTSTGQYVIKNFLKWLLNNTTTQGTYSYGYFQDDGLDTVEQFTNDTAGIIKGSALDGQIYAETNGTGSVNGWSSLKTQVNNIPLTNNIAYNYSNTSLSGLSINDVNYRLLPLGSLANSSCIAIGTNSSARPYLGFEGGSIVIGNNATANSWGYNIAIGQNANCNGAAGASIGHSASSTGVASVAIGGNSYSNIDYVISFDSINKTAYGSEKNRTLWLSDSTKLFFRNEDISSSKTTLSAYTNGYSLSERLNGLTLSDNSITELKCNQILSQSLSSNITYTFETAPTSTGTNLSCKPEYKAEIATSADNISLTLPSTNTYKLVSNDSGVSLATNVITLATAGTYEISIKQVGTDYSILIYNWSI